jgi:uncharacterized protein YukE
MGLQSHPIRGPRPGGSVTGLTLEEIRARLSSTDPEKVAAAGRSYNSAAKKLAETQKELAAARAYLEERWKGPAATEALTVIRRLEGSARNLSAASAQAGSALQRYGEQILSWYKNHLPDDGYIKTGKDDEYARKVMTKLNMRIARRGGAWKILEWNTDWIAVAVSFRRPLNLT